MPYVSPSKVRRQARQAASARRRVQLALDTAQRQATEATQRADKLDGTMSEITNTIAGIKTPNGTLRKINRLIAEATA